MVIENIDLSVTCIVFLCLGEGGSSVLVSTTSTNLFLYLLYFKMLVSVNLSRRHFEGLEQDIMNRSSTKGKRAYNLIFVYDTLI